MEWNSTYTHQTDKYILERRAAGITMENIDKFRYLGSLVIKDVNCTEEIRSCIDKTSPLTSNLSLELEMLMKKIEIKISRAFKMLCWK